MKARGIRLRRLSPIAAAVLIAAGCGGKTVKGDGGNPANGGDGGAAVDAPRSAVADAGGGGDAAAATDAQLGGGDGGAPAPNGLHASGNQILDKSGKPVLLHGVNRSGSEYACIQDFGFFDGPTDAASIAAIASWGANAVRVPLNEDCWLAINGAPAAYSGDAYRQAIAGYVTRLEAGGMIPILDLHWSAPGTQKATGQKPMPDRDHSIDFWRSVAGRFKNDGRVVLELFNEPFPDSNRDTTAAWTCWRDGGTCPGQSYQAAGMQDLVNAVRGAGAGNLVLLGGVQYSNSLWHWQDYRPNDPNHNLAAAWHVYNFNPNVTQSDWDAMAGNLASTTPIVATEVGDDDCSQFITGVMNWLDGKGQSYLAWTWDTWGTACGKIALVSSYDGTPTPYGQIFKDHLASLPP